MERYLKERLTGATVLVIFGVIFIPMVLNNPTETQDTVRTVLPPKLNTEYQSRIIPVERESVLENNFQSIPVDLGNSIEQPKPVISATEEPESNNAPAELNVKTSSSLKNNIDINEITKTKVIQESVEGLSAWIVQLGSFSNQSNAESLVSKLLVEKYPAYIDEILDNSESVFRVRVGTELNREDAEKLQQTLVSQIGIEGIILSYP